MSGLFGSKQATSQTPNYVGIPVQTSVSTLALTVGWGTGRLAPNLFWYGDFTQKQAASSSGGKGGGGKGSGAADYTASIALGLCEGPITGIANVWIDQTTTESLSQYGFSLYNGTLTQSPWGYLSSKHADQSLNYPGVAYVVAENYDLGSTPNVPNHNFEVIFPSAGQASWLNAQDADVALTIQDFLLNQQYGIPGYPTEALDTVTLLSGPNATTTGDASLQTWCRANGWGFSPILDSQEKGASILQRWLDMFSVAPVWSDKKLKFIPRGDQPVTGNGVTYLPDLTPVYDLDDDDFLDAGPDEDPVLVSRIDPKTAKNVVRLEVTNRANQYNLVPVEARDQNAIEQYGLQVAATMRAHEICDPAIAQHLAQAILQRGIHIRKGDTFKLGLEFGRLEPMDLITITDPMIGTRVVVRITQVDEDDVGDLTITCEEFPQGIATATLYASQVVSNMPNNWGVAAAPVNVPDIFEPPQEISGNAQVWIAVSGGTSGVYDPNWGGCQVWAATDTSSFAQIGTINAPARMGVLASTLNGYSGANPDTADTLAVDLVESNGNLDGTSALNAMGGITLCWCDGEFLSYTESTLAAGPIYNLTGLYRGLHNSPIGAHAAGSRFARLDDAIFKYDIPSFWFGQTIHLKFVSFNVFGGGLQDISTCTAYSYTVGSSAVQPAMPTGFTAEGGDNANLLKWDISNDASVTGYRVFGVEGDDADFSDAAVLANPTGDNFTHFNVGYGATWSYWLEAVNASAASDPAGPRIATSSANIDGSKIVNISEDALAAALVTKIDTSSSAATSVGTIQESIASLIQLVDTAIGTATASVQDEAETRANADGSVMAERTIKVQALSDGRQAIAGIGLIAEASGESTQSEVLILADRFVVASVNEDGSVVAIAPLVIDAGIAYFAGKVYMNDLVTTAETTELLEIHPPADGSGGLKVYSNDGTGEKLVFDPTHGLGIGQATPVYTVSLTSSVSIGAMGTVVSLPSESFYGRAALVFVDIQTDEVHYDGALQNITLYVQVDGTTVSSIVVTSGQSASESFLLLPAKLTAAVHTISLALSSEAGDSGATTVTACNLSVLDFKA